MNPQAETARAPEDQPFNQVPLLTDYNLFLADKTLVAGMQCEGASWAVDQVTQLGRLLGSAEAQRRGFDANENRPVLHTHDPVGNRRDEVVFHPAWHQLMRTSIEHRVHSLPFVEQRKGAQVARAALMMLTAQNEAGHTCPISMTFSGFAALKVEPDLLQEWGPRILSPNYDPRFIPASDKAGVLLGMGMTEKQGGSDVRANITRAQRLGRSREYLINGHKWFVSAPMCDAFLILAQTENGLSCFFMPRWKPSGEKNNFFIQRLKDKMGNRSNASSEVEFVNAWAQLVGEEGRGVNTIIEMVNHTRLDCAIAAAALMRQALVQAVHHCSKRRAFGKLLIEQPLMRNVLADLAIESEAATLMMIRLAAAFDRRETDDQERSFARIATAVAKFWLCKRAPVQVGEALECLGGNGYVEESVMPRLYREAPLYSIWEGSGNVICLDILRALSRDPAVVDAVINEVRLFRGGDQRFDGFLMRVESSLTRHLKEIQNRSSESQQHARRLAEELALAIQAGLVMRHSSPELAEAFIVSRLARDHGHTFGTLPVSVEQGSILEPVIAGLSA